MSVALAGSAPATFEIKSANLPLVALLLKTADLSALAADLSARFGDMPDFFDHDPLVIDLTALEAADATLDFPALIGLLRPLRVLPLAVRGGSAAQMAAAQAAGLAPAADAVVQRSMAPPPAPAGALVVERPLRSGQQVYARGRDLVVLAMVNPGAEVIADGNIHVYAPLRGKAMAGARGNTDARIFALSLEPELVSIAGIYRTSETPFPDDIRGKAAQVRLSSGPDGDKLVMDALHA